MWQGLYRLLFRYLLNLGLAREDAEDLAQETLAVACLVQQAEGILSFSDGWPETSTGRDSYC